MNKEIIDCIKAEKEKETLLRKEKEAKIQTIKDFFKDLPGGLYHIRLVDYIETEKKSHWYSKPYKYDKTVYKEWWGKSIGAYWVDIKVERSVNIEKGYTHIHGTDIERWSDDEVNIFSEHLDWFEQELGKEYCKGKA